MTSKLSIDRFVESEPSAWQVFWCWKLPLVAWLVSAPVWVPLWLVGEGALWCWRRAVRSVK